MIKEIVNLIKESYTEDEWNSLTDGQRQRVLEKALDIAKGGPGSGRKGHSSPETIKREMDNATRQAQAAAAAGKKDLSEEFYDRAKKLKQMLDMSKDDSDILDVSMTKSVAEKLEELSKGKKVPVGTVRGNYVKTAQGWKYNKKGKDKRESTSDADSKFGGGEKIVGAKWGDEATMDKLIDDNKNLQSKIDKMIKDGKSKMENPEYKKLIDERDANVKKIKDLTVKMNKQ